MALNIVLIEPEIPTNTGNIGRLAIASGSRLHLVKPFGFEINDKRLKRAGLDYWKHLDVKYYDGIDDFFKMNKDASMYFLSTHGKASYSKIPFKDNAFLIFGKESVGLSKTIIGSHSNSLFNIPLYSDKVRSLNLANSVAIVVYEGLRQLGIKD